VTTMLEALEALEALELLEARCGTCISQGQRAPSLGVLVGTSAERFAHARRGQNGLTPRLFAFGALAVPGRLRESFFFLTKSFPFNLPTKHGPTDFAPSTSPRLLGGHTCQSPATHSFSSHFPGTESRRLLVQMKTVIREAPKDYLGPY
jgi:hypothetical protein